MQNSELWPILVFVLWWGFLLWYWNRRASSEKKSVDESWGNLARLNGLTYTPVSSSLIGITQASKKPHVNGEYRGHSLVLTIIVESVDIYDGSVSLASTVIMLQIINRVDCSLFVHEKGLIRRVFGASNGDGEINGLNPRFTIKGSPRSFVQRAQTKIKPLMWQREVMGVNRSSLFWTSHSKLPSISLEGSKLAWKQYDVVIGVQELNELFSLLYELAELAEETENLGIAP